MKRGGDMLSDALEAVIAATGAVEQALLSSHAAVANEISARQARVAAEGELHSAQKKLAEAQERLTAASKAPTR